MSEQSIYNDQPQVKKKESYPEDFILYLDNYTTITLGKLIKKTKKIVDILPPDSPLILMVTNSRCNSDIDTHVQRAYYEYGYYIQNLIKGNIIFTIVFRGVICDLHISLLECKCNKFISDSTIIEADTKDEYKTQFNLKNL